MVMKKNTFFIISIVIGLIVLIALFFYVTDYNWFPEKYDNITFLFSIFNFLFSSLVIFWVLSWNIDRKQKQKDDFIKKIDELSAKSLKLTSYEVWKKITEIWFSITVIENFDGFYIDDTEKNKLILKSKNNKKFNFKALYDNIDYLDNYLYDFSEFINYIFIKKKLLLTEKDLQIYLQTKLSYFSNLDFYYSLFIIHYCSWYNIEANVSSDLETRQYLIINNKRAFKKILQFKKHWDEVLKLLKDISW